MDSSSATKTPSEVPFRDPRNETRWSVPTLILFRFALVYLGLYSLVPIDMAAARTFHDRLLFPAIERFWVTAVGVDRNSFATDHGFQSLLPGLGFGRELGTPDAAGSHRTRDDRSVVARRSPPHAILNATRVAATDHPNITRTHDGELRPSRRSSSSKWPRSARTNSQLPWASSHPGNFCGPSWANLRATRHSRAS